MVTMKMVTMNQQEARRRIWERMATTAETDGTMNCDWILDESEDPKDHERLLRACEEVAAIIRRRLTKKVTAIIKRRLTKKKK